MTVSPDVPPLVELALVDAVDAQTLTEQAILDAQTKLPGWVPREGHTEVVLLEAQALMTEELAYAMNRVPGALLEELLGVYGLERDAGTAPATTLTFTTSAVADVLVPAGTRVRVYYEGGASALDFLTDADLLIVGGAMSGTTAATAEIPTSALNGTPPAAAELVDAIAAIDTVATATQVLGGVDPEDSAAYRARGATLFRRLVSTLVLPEHFTAAAVEFPAVVRAATFDLFDPGAGSGAPGDHPGHVTVAATGAGGTPLTAGVKLDLTTSLETKAHAAIMVHVVDATITDVDVTAQVKVTLGFDEATVLAAVEAAVRGYLNADVWPFDGTVYRNELIALLSGVVGVDRVTALTAPAADVVLSGTAPLARAGAVTITAA